MNIDEIMEKQAQVVVNQLGGEPQTSGSEEGGAQVDQTVSNEADQPVSENTPNENGDDSQTPAGGDTDGASSPSGETQQVDSPDYSKFLEESSGGLIKSVEEFTQTLAKVKEVDELKQKISEFENKKPFANEFVEKLNALVQSGKTQEQIDTFIALSKLGDIDKLDPFEVKVQRLVFDGFPRATAERVVKNDFGLNVSVDPDLLTEEEFEENKLKLEDANIKLKLSSKEDAEYLKGQLAKIESDGDKQARIVAEKAAKEQYLQRLEPFTKELAKEYDKGVSVQVKAGDVNVDYKIEFDDEFKANIPSLAKDFFADNVVNEENVKDFKGFLNAQYVASKLTTEILPNAIKHGYSLGLKAATEQFENRGGLPQAQASNEAPDPKEEIRQAQRAVAFGED